MKLYTFFRSSASYRVRIALNLKGISCEQAPIHLRRGGGEQLMPAYKAINPQALVPALEDDGRILTQSLAIIEYLEEKYPNPPLQPKDPYLRARGRILIDYFLNYLHEPYWALRGEMIKKNEAERDQKRIAETREEVTVRLQYLEAALGDKPYFLGDYSLTDIAMLPRFPRLEQYGVLPSAALPKLTAWFARMKERPSVKTIL